jgi:hypothetical protein
MAQPWKFLATVFGVVIIIPVAIVLWVLFSEFFLYHQSRIIDFHPTSFPVQADSKFFYSIGEDLKYSDRIAPDTPSLFHGKFMDFLVSPDGDRIAVVANGSLLIISGDGSINREVTPVSSIYKEPKPLGEQFYRNEDFQWSEDSKNFYLIKDEYYQTRGSQLFSIKGELWVYEIVTGNMQMVLKPFPASKYFFGKNSGVYFSIPTPEGNLRLRYFDGERTYDIGIPNDTDIVLDQPSPDSLDSIFFSFSIHDYTRSILAKKGVRLVTENDGPQELLIGTKPILGITLGEGFKGSYYGSEMFRSVILPGDRYFVFNVNCGNYDGQLLIDTTNGNYMALPKDTRVYITMNTSTFKDFRITGSGIEAGR